MLPKPVDINAFSDASALLVEQLAPEWSINDFSTINGIIGMWCLLRMNSKYKAMNDTE